MKGGSGNDSLWVGKEPDGPYAYYGVGGPHHAVVTGGPGVDHFNFVNWGTGNAELLRISTGNDPVQITDFQAGVDKIGFDTLQSVNVPPYFTAVSVQSMQTTAATSAAEVWGLITPLAGGTASMAVAKVVSGSQGKAWLYVDDSDGRVVSGADMLIEITGYSGTLTSADFIFTNL
jgi:hypothetical protein